MSDRSLSSTFLLISFYSCFHVWFSSVTVCLSLCYVRICLCTTSSMACSCLQNARPALYSMMVFALIVVQTNTIKVPLRRWLTCAYRAITPASIVKAVLITSVWTAMKTLSCTSSVILRCIAIQHLYSIVSTSQIGITEFMCCWLPFY